MIIRIQVQAKAWLESTKETTDAILASVDGVDHDEFFSEYLVDAANPLAGSLQAKGGRLHFQYDTKTKELLANVDYGVAERLDSEQQSALVEYTLGQLSDGIGENFVQDFVTKTGVFIAFDLQADHAVVEYFV